MDEWRRLLLFVSIVLLCSSIQNAVASSLKLKCERESVDVGELESYFIDTQPIRVLYARVSKSSTRRHDRHLWGTLHVTKIYSIAY